MVWSPVRRNRLLLVIAFVLIISIILWIARDALFPFLLALALAYILLPFVNQLDVSLQKPLRGSRAARGLAILIVYGGTIALVAGFLLLVAPIIVNQYQVLWESREELLTGGERLVDRILLWYGTNIPTDIQDRFAAFVRQAGGTIGAALQTGFTRTVSVVRSMISFIIGLVVVPFWLFYVLYDQSRAMRGAISLVPLRFRPDFLNLMRIADTTMGAYLRGQLLLCLVVGGLATLGLSLLGVSFPFVLGLLAGIFEILPFIGAIIGMIPAVIVAAIQEPALAAWTVLLFIVIQQFENLFLVPRISGRAVELHPAVVMFVLVIGNQVAGLWGMLFAVPVTAILRDTFKYLYLRFQDVPVPPGEAMAQISASLPQIDV